MASYKQTCIYCNTLIDSDTKFCPKCGHRDPLAVLCPSCLWEVATDDPICAGCGRPLFILCPKCGKETFVLEKCQVCSESLMVDCPNMRCGEKVFFDVSHCRACGKKLGRE